MLPKTPLKSQATKDTKKVIGSSGESNPENTEIKSIETDLAIKDLLPKNRTPLSKKQGNWIAWSSSFSHHLWAHSLFDPETELPAEGRKVAVALLQGCDADLQQLYPLSNPASHSSVALWKSLRAFMEGDTNMRFGRFQIRR